MRDSFPIMVQQGMRLLMKGLPFYKVKTLYELPKLFLLPLEAKLLSRLG